MITPPKMFLALHIFPFEAFQTVVHTAFYTFSWDNNVYYIIKGFKLQ